MFLLFPNDKLGPMIAIRELTERDKPAFDKIFAETVFEEFPEYSEKTRKWFIAEKYRDQMFTAGVRFGAFDGNKLVGYLVGPSLHGGVSYVFWLAVAREQQKQGIGSKLLEFHEKWALQNGIHSIQLQTDERNLAFYKAKGFDQLGFDDKGYFGVDSYNMRKLIAEPNEENFLK